MRVAAIHTYPIKGCYRVDLDRCRVEPWGLASDRRWLIVDPTGRAITQRDNPGLTQLRPRLEPDGTLVVRATDGRPDLVVAQPGGEAKAAEVTVWGFHGSAARAGADADAWLSAALGRDARLVWADDPTRRPVDQEYARPGDVVSFADDFPLLATNAASLEVLNDWLAESGYAGADWPLPMTRFRPNLVVSGALPWAEDGWLGRRLRVGTVTLRAVKPCGRCVVTTTDQETGERGREPLATLARRRRISGELLFGMNLIPDAPGEVTVGDLITVE